MYPKSCVDLTTFQSPPGADWYDRDLRLHGTVLMTAGTSLINLTQFEENVRDLTTTLALQ